MMFMKMICKEKDVNAKEDKKQAEALNREFYVIDPKTGFLDVRGADEIEGKSDSTPDTDDPEHGIGKQYMGKLCFCGSVLYSGLYTGQYGKRLYHSENRFGI